MRLVGELRHPHQRSRVADVEVTGRGIEPIERRVGVFVRRDFNKRAHDSLHADNSITSCPEGFILKRMMSFRLRMPPWRKLRTGPKRSTFSARLLMKPFLVSPFAPIFATTSEEQGS